MDHFEVLRFLCSCFFVNSNEFCHGVIMIFIKPVLRSYFVTFGIQIIVEVDCDWMHLVIGCHAPWPKIPTDLKMIKICDL